MSASDPNDLRTKYIDAMQLKLEQSVEDLILTCFGNEFPQDAQNAKFVLASIFHVCGHLAANNMITAPELIGLAAHETLDAQRCIANEAMHTLMKKAAEAMAPAPLDPPKDVN